MFKVYTEKDYLFKDENGNEYISSPEMDCTMECLVLLLWPSIILTTIWLSLGV